MPLIESGYSSKCVVEISLVWNVYISKRGEADEESSEYDLVYVL